MLPRERILSNLQKFRLEMGLPLSTTDVKRIWGRQMYKELNKEQRDSLLDYKQDQVSYKVFLAEKYIKNLKILNWVKFIGISGSVAAGFADKEDDIDIFLVVRNGTVWIYRALIVFLNLFHNKIRSKRHRNVKDKLCLNMICEERGLEFENDIFNFHELMFLIPIYNEKYLNYIYSQNPWLEKDYYVKKELLRTKIQQEKNIFFLIQFLNKIAFIFQLLFMLLSGHKPDTKRLIENSRKGRIEFFEKTYKEEKIDNYLNSFKSTN